MKTVEQPNISGNPLMVTLTLLASHLICKGLEGVMNFPWLSSAAALATIVSALATMSPSLRSAIDGKIKRWFKL